jgi:sec-independent protein translocase protein TatA
LNLTEKFAVLRPAFALSFQSMFEILIIVVVLLLVFGAGKVRSAGSDLGAAVKGFRKGLQSSEAKQPPATPAPAPEAADKPGTLPDAEFPEVVAERARRSGKPGA